MPGKAARCHWHFAVTGLNLMLGIGACPAPPEKWNGAPRWQKTHSQWDGKEGRVGTGWRASCGLGALELQVGGDCTVTLEGVLSGFSPQLLPTQAVSAFQSPPSLIPLMARPPLVQVLVCKEVK